MRKRSKQQCEVLFSERDIIECFRRSGFRHLQEAADRRERELALVNNFFDPGSSSGPPRRDVGEMTHEEARAILLGSGYTARGPSAQEAEELRAALTQGHRHAVFQLNPNGGTGGSY
jgi:hypothetical protein